MQGAPEAAILGRRRATGSAGRTVPVSGLRRNDGDEGAQMRDWRTSKRRISTSPM